MQRSNHLLIFVGEIYGPLFMERLCNIIEPLWKDDDKFKQRAAAEIMIGLIIGEFTTGSCFRSLKGLQEADSGAPTLPRRFGTGLWRGGRKFSRG